MRAEQLLNKALDKLCCVPGWLWRAMFSAAMGLVLFFTVVPWAQAQRAQPTAGGEYLLTFMAAALPWVVFRSRR